MTAEIEELPGGELGQLFISERALEMIVYGALLEVEGLYPPDRVKGRGLLNSLSRAHQGDGIQILRVPVEAERPAEASEGEETPPEPEKRLKVKLSLVAEYGVPIHKAAEQAIETVRRRVKELAGLDVDEVDVEITGIVPPAQ
jgi:uncharacterized alkaline shock family protein YloU